jgi:hypothetical protein
MGEEEAVSEAPGTDPKRKEDMTMVVLTIIFVLIMAYLFLF